MVGIIKSAVRLVIVAAVIGVLDIDEATNLICRLIAPPSSC